MLRTLKHYGTKLWNSLYHVVHFGCAISTFKCDFLTFECNLSSFRYFILCLQFSFHRMFSTLHNALCPCSSFACEITVKMNLGHISITSSPIVKVEISLLLFIVFKRMMITYVLYDQMFLPKELWWKFPSSLSLSANTRIPILIPAPLHHFWKECEGHSPVRSSRGHILQLDVLEMQFSCWL